MRKKGKSRLSTGEKRAKRYRAKYQVDPVVKRYKRLLPHVYPWEETALISWDFLETLLFAEYAELGIPSDEQPNYTAWAKRKAEMSLFLSQETLKAEIALLTEEFITRGLNSSWLASLELVVDLWVMLMRSTVKVYETWLYAEPPAFSLLFSDEWSYTEPPSFSLLHSESWSV